MEPHRTVVPSPDTIDNYRIVRHERIMPDGRKRNSVRFSIIDDEWPQVRQRLGQMLAAYG